VLVTKSISLTEDEASQFGEYVEATGEAEATVLKEAALRGLQNLRLERGIRAFREGRGSSESAAIAGVPRAIFLEMLMDMGETLDRGPSRLPETLEFLGKECGDERLVALAHKLAEGID
jgi:hypothetical protein